MQSGGPVAQERYPLCHIAVLDLGPAAIDHSVPTPLGEALFGRHRNQLARPLTQGCVVSIERMEPGAKCQAVSERWHVSQPPRLGDCRAAPCQCLVRIAEAEEYNPQNRL